MHLSRARQKLVAFWSMTLGAAIVVGVVAAFHLISPVRADSYEGLQSYDQGRKEEAIRLLRRAAWQENDLFAQLKLGEIYNVRNETDKGFHDPVEAAVWYYLALVNVTAEENLYLDKVIDELNQRFTDASGKLSDIYQNLLQDERIDLRNRIIYIEACRGPDGMMLLGQLHDTRGFDRTSIYKPPSYVVGNNYGDAYWTNDGPVGVGNQSPTAGGFGGVLSSIPYNVQPFIKSDLEARMFYQLAESEGHPLAKLYLKGLSDYTTYSAGNVADPKAQARAKADRWLAPFEFYAAETRYRGELPSGLVLSDECPVNYGREHALALARQLVPPQIVFEMLDLLGFARGFSPHDMGRAIAKYQDFLGDPETGELTAIQLVRLIQIAAVRGHKKAERCLGIMYVRGVGVVKNLVRAEKWLMAAAEQGDGEAMYALSELYSLGGPGIEKNEDKANRYRQGSAVAGWAPVRSEFLRLLDNPPPSEAPSAPPRGSHHHYRHASGEQSSDE